MDENEKTIEYRVENGVATIVLNRPHRFNSLTEQMHRELRNTLKQVAANKELRCLVLTGAGKGFCTGQDLNDRYAMVQEGEVNLGASLENFYRPVVTALGKLDIPVICAVNGVAAGAGISLALACDIVIAANSASFSFAFAKVGLVPDAGATWMLVQSLGLPRANAVAMLGDTLSAQEAQQAGLIYKSVPDETLDDEISATVKRLIANPALGLSLTKRALKAAAVSDFQEQLTNEAQLQTVAGRSPDYKEAVCAFVEKRAPVFGALKKDGDK